MPRINFLLRRSELRGSKDDILVNALTLQLHLISSSQCLTFFWLLLKLCLFVFASTALLPTPTMRRACPSNAIGKIPLPKVESEKRKKNKSTYNDSKAKQYRTKEKLMRGM